MSSHLPDSARRVQAALLAASVDAAVVELPASTRTAQQAAAAIGSEVRQIWPAWLHRARLGGITAFPGTIYAGDAGYLKQL